MDSADPQNRSERRGHLRERLVKNRSNFGEVDVAPAKTDKVNKVEK